MLPSDKTWEKDAACLKIKDWILEDYTPEDYSDRKEACGHCPVINQCREWVDSFEKPVYRHMYDVYAGETPAERLERRRNKAVPKPDPCANPRPRTIEMHRRREEPLCDSCEALLDRKEEKEKRLAMARQMILDGHNNHFISITAGVWKVKLKQLREEMKGASVLP